MKPCRLCGGLLGLNCYDPEKCTWISNRIKQIAMQEEHAERLAALNAELLKELEIRASDLAMLRKAIEAADPRNELFVRIDDMLRETRAAISKARGGE